MKIQVLFLLALFISLFISISLSCPDGKSGEFSIGNNEIYFPGGKIVGIYQALCFRRCKPNTLFTFRCYIKRLDCY